VSIAKHFRNRIPLLPLSIAAGVLLALLIPFAPPLHAQERESALSQKEIEEVRDSRYYPNDCILLFVKFLDLRTDEIKALYAKPRKPGREQDTHDLLEQFTSIADELSDNLDDYGPRHADLRRALPKILDATDRWSSTLKSPPDDPAYIVARKLALESIRDLRESTTELVAEQAAWFKAHPPAKQPAPNETAPPIDIPR
jgi:hypothetical protein